MLEVCLHPTSWAVYPQTVISSRGGSHSNIELMIDSSSVPEVMLLIDLQKECDLGGKSNLVVQLLEQ